MRVSFLAAAALAAAGLATPAAPDTLTNGYVTKSATNQGWILINKDAADAATEEGATFVERGPAQEGSLAGQLAAIGLVIIGAVWIDVIRQRRTRLA